MKFSNKIIEGVLYATIGLIAVLLVMLFLQIFNAISITRIQSFLSETFIDNALAFLFPFLIATITLKKTTDIQAVDSLARLRTMLNSDEKKKIHQDLIEKAKEEDELSVEQLDYIGIIELGAIMHRKGIIDDKELYNQFGYRVENIMKSSLHEKLSRDTSYYKDYFYIEDVIKKYASKKS